ncbi:hypothetical protein [Sphaerotilus sp.]|jgi:hypothetical protein|uniref:hypothetical protein n=1 Tax=Sphaerotilus sp. TaxID=2093942 RepID=UPI0025F0BAF6|nr:hypothetical protein [Sphaerotilus sp.]
MPTATVQPAEQQQMFTHQRSWTTSQLLWSLSVTAIFTPPMLLAYVVRGVELPLLVVAGLLVVLLVFGGLWNRDVTGAWRIQVTQEEVTWETPHNLDGNQSFKVKPSDIEVIVSEPTGEHHGSSPRQYGIVMANGDHHRLHPSLSGIDLEGFCNALQKLGVTHCKHP